VLAIAWRYVAHAAMVAVALWNEQRGPMPPLRDVALDHVPRVDWVVRHNYHLWLVAWLPLALWFLRRDRAACLRFLWLGGVVSLLRAVTIPLTGLGPVDGLDQNAGADAATLWRSWLAIVNPWSALTSDAPHVALTKDLFFSGHVATTFLLWLYCRRIPRLGGVALVAHVGTTAAVLFAHLHYAIDVVGAWAVTFSVYVLAEGWSARRSSASSSSSRRSGLAT
jgi:hypothetical protein